MIPTETPGGAYTVLTHAPTTQADTAIQAIKDYILTSHLQPGDSLPTESQLCTDLGVSRSSVREAVRTLVALDIVEVRHGYGMFVGDVSMRPMVESLVFRGLLHPGDDYRGLRDIVEVRLTLDLAIAERVTQAWKGRQDQALESLESLVTQMEERAAAGHTFVEQDRAFHNQLLSPLENHLFRHLSDAFWTVHTLTIPLLDAPHPADIITTARAHRAMLDAARSGDVKAYRSAVVEHFEPLQRALGEE